MLPSEKIFTPFLLLLTVSKKVTKYLSTLLLLVLRSRITAGLSSMLSLLMRLFWIAQIAKSHLKVINPLSVSIQSCGKKRLILDFRYVNQHVFKQKLI